MLLIFSGGIDFKDYVPLSFVQCLVPPKLASRAFVNRAPSSVLHQISIDGKDPKEAFLLYKSSATASPVIGYCHKNGDKIMFLMERWGFPLREAMGFETVIYDYVGEEGKDEEEDEACPTCTTDGMGSGNFQVCRISTRA